MKRLILLLALTLVSSTLFAQNVYYSTNSSHSAEVATAAGVLATSLGGTATGFNTSVDAEWVTALAGAQVILLGQGASISGLSATTETDITAWTNAGGALMGLWTQENMDLLNLVSGASMTVISCCASGVGTLQPEAAGTSFDGAPATINLNVSNATGVAAASLPPAALAAYTDSSGNAQVVTMGVGSGSIAFLSWDWCCSATAQERADWDAAMLSSATFAAGEAPSVIRFNVTKTFTDLLESEVEVTLTCNGGLPLEQNYMLAGGSEVTFVLTDFQAGETDCTVTETGGPDGYTATLNGGTECTFENISAAFYTCSIINTPAPVSFEVDVDWDISEDADPGLGAGVMVEIYCEDFNGSTSTTMPAGPMATMPVTVTGLVPEGFCNAVLTNLGSVIDANSCLDVDIEVGSDASCDITATAFFEGIPTLSQYGMALMALLMLGVGFVGFRRFV